MLKFNKIFKMPLIKSKKIISDFEFLKSVEDFQKIIRCERARANRNNENFTLVVFEVTKQNLHEKYINIFVNCLSSRIRLNDELGWFDDKRIGIMLPNTNRKGAIKFLDVLKKRLSNNMELPEFIFTIYEYPSLFETSSYE